MRTRKDSIRAVTSDHRSSRNRRTQGYEQAGQVSCSFILRQVQTASPNDASSAPSSRPFAPKQRSLSRFIPAILLIVYVLQCGWFIRTQSLTYDEPCHVYAGLDAWRHGRFLMWNDHPSLPRLWMALPLLSHGFDVEFVDLKAEKVVAREVSPDAVTIANRGRWMNVLLGVALAVALWVAARAFFSIGAANFALALFVFSPDLIAHFSLITTDGIAVLMIFVSALALVWWRREPSWRRTAVMGVVLGALLLSKFYAPAFFVMALVIMLFTGREGLIRSVRRWHWRKVVAAGAVALFVVWAGYFFHVSHVTIRDGHVLATFPNRTPFEKDTRSIRNLNVWVPAGEYIDGLREVQFHNKLGHPAFFLGHVSWGRIRAYYPVAMALKWPPVVLALSAIGLALLVLQRREFSIDRRLDFVILALFPLVSLLLAVNARIHIGVRHVLPVYPFLLLLAAGVWWMAERALRRRVWIWVLVVAATLNAVDASRYAPDYLSYFTPFVRAARAHEFITDSNLDWGQGLLALREYQRDHPREAISLAYFGTMDPALYGIRYVAFGEKDRPTGTVVISRTVLSGQYANDPNAFRWLEKYPVKAVLNHSLFVYEVK